MLVGWFVASCGAFGSRSISLISPPKMALGGDSVSNWYGLAGSGNSCHVFRHPSRPFVRSASWSTNVSCFGVDRGTSLGCGMATLGAATRGLDRRVHPIRPGGYQRRPTKVPRDGRESTASPRWHAAAQSADTSRRFSLRGTLFGCRSFVPAGCHRRESGPRVSPRQPIPAPHRVS